jgi:hypothetical protein
MRPLTRPTLIESRQSDPAWALLLSAFGPYCAISEEPIYDVGFIWDKAQNSEHPFQQPVEDRWNNLLLLAPATFKAWQRHHAPEMGEVLLPDRDMTFSILNPAFVYSLEEVNVMIVDRNGEPVKDRREPALLQSGARQMTIVRGRDSAAQATIDMFSLNGDFFDAHENVLRIREPEYLSRADARLENRTAAWQRAAHAAALIADVSATNRTSILGVARSIAATTGFWSVWATILWQRFQDTGLLASVLDPVGLQNGEEFVGAGPHNDFPGTSRGWRQQRGRVAVA